MQRVLSTLLIGLPAAVAGFYGASFAFRLEDRQPTIYVYFFRGRRTIFNEENEAGRPRYHDQVSSLVGKRVRVIGKALNGAVYVDVGHIVPAEAAIQ